LQRIFAAFREPLPFAMVISQHMPAGFTGAFAERLNRSTGFEVKEAKDGDEVVAGQALIAPGGKNLLFARSGDKVLARVVPPGAKDRYVPSVDEMFCSCADIYKDRMLAVVLTGMGNDGARGVREAKRLGAQIVAESEESSVVFGMPREAIATGFVDRVVPMDAMVREIVYRCGLMPRFG
jgi:two-component system chemotaxis response regulator CheB